MCGVRLQGAGRGFEIAQMTIGGSTGSNLTTRSSQRFPLFSYRGRWLRDRVDIVTAAEEEEKGRSKGEGQTSTHRTFVSAYVVSSVILVGYAVTVFATSADGSRLLVLVTAAAVVTLDVLLTCLAIISVDAEGDGTWS